MNEDPYYGEIKCQATLKSSGKNKEKDKVCTNLAYYKAEIELPG